jgi:hypothetical protein
LDLYKIVLMVMTLPILKVPIGSELLIAMYLSDACIHRSIEIPKSIYAIQCDFVDPIVMMLRSTIEQIFAIFADVSIENLKLRII